MEEGYRPPLVIVEKALALWLQNGCLRSTMKNARGAAIVSQFVPLARWDGWLAKLPCFIQTFVPTAPSAKRCVQLVRLNYPI